MQEPDEERAVRERAYFLWESEGRPEGRALAHWQHAAARAEFDALEVRVEGLVRGPVRDVVGNGVT
jgi:hypothetical protein